MSSSTSLHSSRALFEAQIPEHLRESLRVVKCTQRHWRVSIPGSKSFTNRAIVLAALGGRPIVLKEPLLADDTWWGFLSLNQLGFQLDLSSLPSAVSIRPPKTKIKSPNEPHAALLHVGQAGTLGRFLPAALLNWQRVYPDSALTHFMVTAHDQLSRRPLEPLISALNDLGGIIETDVAHVPGETQIKSFPLSVSPSHLKGLCRVDGSTSGQFLSGVLLAAAGSRNDCRVVRIHSLVQPDYVRMTLQMLQDFGSVFEANDDLTLFKFHPCEWTPPAEFLIEADASTACYYAALACVFGIDVEIENLGSRTLQPDFEFFEILKQFGFTVDIQDDRCSVFGSRQRTEIPKTLKFDMSRCSDQALTLGVMAIVTGIEVEVTGIAHIRHHESDRIASFCANCRALGIEVEERADGFRVHAKLKRDQIVGDWPTHHDHRFALSGLVLAAWASGVRVLQPTCMQKTAPSFIEHLQSLGVEFTPI